jgi:hypothetical protein
MTEAHTEAQQGELVADATTIAHLARVEIDTQIATARQFPRDLGRFKQSAMSMATLDRETAESCMFAVPRKGKMITGPSVRLAEIVTNAWGNIRVAERISEVGDTYVVAQGVCHDLQTNTSKTTEVRRRITDKYGKRYNDDMITMTCNAACSIAGRNAVFKVVPRALVDPIYAAAKKTAVGDAATLDERRQAALDKFALMGVDEERVLARVGKESVEAIDLQDLGVLIGLYTAIHEGSANVDESFPRPEDDGASIREKLDNLKQKATAGAPAEEPEEADTDESIEATGPETASAWGVEFWGAARTREWTRDELAKACADAISCGTAKADFEKWLKNTSKAEVIAHIESIK